VNAPANPDRYLNTLYGDDWKQVGYEVYDHSKEKRKKKIKKRIDNFSPAYPLGPLNN